METTLSRFWGTWGTDLTYGALGALAWGTRGTGALRMGHLGHSLGALVVLGHYVWGTWGTTFSNMGHYILTYGALGALQKTGGELY